jgi:hypothetical protein
MRRARKIPVTVRAAMALAATLVLVVVVLVVYVAVSERGAERKAIAFCLAVKVGDSPVGLLEQAKAAGASGRQSHWTQLDSGERDLSAVFEGATSQSRHVCSVQTKDSILRADYLRPE